MIWFEPRAPCRSATSGAVLVTGLERLFDQKPTKAGAIDEKISAYPFAVFQYQRCDIPALAVLFDAFDPALDTFYALGLELLAQKTGVESRIQVIGIVDLAGL